MVNYEKMSPEEKVRCILDALANERISDGLLELIQGWVLSDDNQDAKEKELDRILDRLFIELKEPQERTNRLLAELHERYGLPPVEKSTPRRMSVRRRMLIRIAAVVTPLLILGGAVWLLTNKAGDETEPVQIAYTTESTFEDTYKEIQLPDGSLIRVGPQTTVGYAADFTADRSVILNGEAFFSVRPFDGKPFTIRTNSLSLTVLGTEFNVIDFDGEMAVEVALFNGKVAVDAGDEHVDMTPMTRLVLDQATGEVDIKGITGREAEAIRKRALTFEDIYLVDVLQRIGRYYGTELHIPEGLEGSRLVRIAFDAGDSLDDVLFALREATKIFDYEIDADTVEITLRK